MKSCYIEKNLLRNDIDKFFTKPIVEMYREKVNQIKQSGEVRFKGLAFRLFLSIFSDPIATQDTVIFIFKYHRDNEKLFMYEDQLTFSTHEMLTEYFKDYINKKTTKLLLTRNRVKIYIDGLN